MTTQCPWHGPHIESCHVCRSGSGLTPADVEAMAAGKGRTALPVAPCGFRGTDRVKTGVAAMHGKNPQLDWFRCGHPAKPLGELVCSCASCACKPKCGPTCRGYVAGEET